MPHCGHCCQVQMYSRGRFGTLANNINSIKGKERNTETDQKAWGRLFFTFAIDQAFLNFGPGNVSKKSSILKVSKIKVGMNSFQARMNPFWSGMNSFQLGFHSNLTFPDYTYTEIGPKTKLSMLFCILSLIHFIHVQRRQ